MAKPVRVAIIGCGTIAKTHIDGFQHQPKPDGQITWLCDTDLQKAQKLSQFAPQAQCTSQLSDVLKADNVDIVSICTDHNNHVDIALAALDAGKNVLCEKPLGITFDSLKRLEVAVKSHPELIFGGVFQHRFDGVLKALKQIVADNSLGTILSGAGHLFCYRPDHYYTDTPWRGNIPGEGGSVLVNQAIHALDALQWIMGGIESAAAVCGNRGHQGIITTEDTLSACLSFKSGAIGSFFATSCSVVDWENKFVVQGTDALVEITDDKVSRIAARNPQINEKIANVFATQQNGEVDDSVAGKVYYGLGHLPLIIDYVQAYQQKRQPTVDFTAAQEAARWVQRIYEACNSKSWVTANC